MLKGGGDGGPPRGQLGHFSCGRKRKWPHISGAPRAGGHVAGVDRRSGFCWVPRWPVGCGLAPPGRRESPMGALQLGLGSRRGGSWGGRSSASPSPPSGYGVLPLRSRLSSPASPPRPLPAGLRVAPGRRLRGISPTDTPLPQPGRLPRRLAPPRPAAPLLPWHRRPLVLLLLPATLA